jgi:hypothetical protein
MHDEKSPFSSDLTVFNITVKQLIGNIIFYRLFRKRFEITAAVTNAVTATEAEAPTLGLLRNPTRVSF